MSRESRTRLHAAVALTALVAGMGCSSLPTAPTPEVASESAPAGAGQGAGPAALLPLQPTSPVTSTRQIYGVVGGLVSAGNFTVVIPPFALPGVATVRVTQPDPSKPYVNLDIFPASANKFRIPVILIANAAPMSQPKLAVAYIVRFNPSTRTWERMPSSEVNLLNRTVICPLEHFSTYGVESGGKAGW